MAKKKRTGKSRSTSQKPLLNLIRAQRNFTLFLILFIVSFLLYSFSVNALFINFFGLLSIIFGFVTLAFLIALVVLLIDYGLKKLIVIYVNY